MELQIRETLQFSNCCSYAFYRFCQWMVAECILPDSQNGFCKGYCTNNCSFILHCAIDKARVLKLPLYVAFVDLVNAFPSTNLPTVWVKLLLREARGSLLDWLCMVYWRMEYAVKQACQQGVAFTMCFWSLWGILAGDTASSGLFTYISLIFALHQMVMTSSCQATMFPTSKRLKMLLSSCCVNCTPFREIWTTCTYLYPKKVMGNT